MKQQVLVSLLILLGVIDLATGQRCPYNWYGYSKTSKCYRFVRATKLTWQDARDFCQSHGGDLLKLDTASERNWVLKQVQNTAKHFNVSNSKWWAGLNNREFLQTWEWADGSRTARGVVPWAPGEPNNHNNEERCAEIVSGTKFNDQACSDKDFFICSRPRNLPLLCDTDNDWETLNGKCYKVNLEKQNWVNAKSQCIEHGGSMVIIENSAVESTIHDFASVNKQALWIGLHSLQVGTAATWVWTNGSQITTDAYKMYWHGIPNVASPIRFNFSQICVRRPLNEEALRFLKKGDC